jgi:hypothetical protein
MQRDGSKGEPSETGPVSEGATAEPIERAVSSEGWLVSPFDSHCIQRDPMKQNMGFAPYVLCGNWMLRRLQ